ncbi:hypothetical protein [Chryseobacterium flavum]|uniref:hypothetical protein n=1 Tax=Chryseobacterium flavum TaxID=415851 RepID=UPI0028A92CE8|nr:hypothetical protein [Chryseobacterium flavum]
MIKKLFQTGAVLYGALLYSQIGINTSEPKATLDIHGFVTDVKKADGLIAPRLTGNQLKAKDGLYTAELKGAIVYATEAASPVTVKTKNITAAGYYYFDGSLWVRFGEGLFNGDPSPDAFIDDASNNMVKLGFSSSGSSRIANSDFVIKDNGNVGIGTTTPTQKLEVAGTAKISRKAMIGTDWTGGGALSVRNNVASENIASFVGSDNIFKAVLLNNGNFGIGTMAPTHKLEVQGTGIISDRLGIGVVDPQNKLDVDGNARFRAVPSGVLNDTDRHVGITSTGTLKKFDMSLPAFGLFASSTQTVTRNADDTPRPLAFEQVNKVDNTYITKIAPNTFRVNKNGIYTVEVWGLFSGIPEANDGPRTGCTIALHTGQKNIQLIGSRWKLSDGTTNVTRTVILNANSDISVETRCERSGNQQYNTAPGSTIFITYLPI